MSLVHEAIRQVGRSLGSAGHGGRGYALWLSLIVTTGAFGACRPQASVRMELEGSVDTAAILSAIDTLAAAVGRADSLRDPVLFASTWAKDGIMSLPGSRPSFGRDSIVDAFKRAPPLPAGASLRIYPLEIRVLSREWAYAFGTDTLTYTPPGARAPSRETSTFLVLIRKTPEGWKTYREVLSPNQQAPLPQR